MPLQLPVLDDRDFEQIFEEARRRIPAFTPEWTNFGVDSDPGITLVQLFAFLTESLLYRANRFPERNRLKFTQLLGVPIQPAAVATGIIAIHNERGPLEALSLNRGVVVSAGSVDFLTRDPINVLPVEALVFYKKRIPTTDPRYADYLARYEAIQAAEQAAAEDAAAVAAATTGAAVAAPVVRLDFYETAQMTAPAPGNANPIVDLVVDAIGGALYLALLAPKNVTPADVRAAIANQVLSIGFVPSLSGDVPSLPPVRPAFRPAPTTSLLYELADVRPGAPVAAYQRLKLLQAPDVLNAIGVVQAQLPGVDGLGAWVFTDPLQEGTGDFPPRIEDQQVRDRLVTWVRVRLPTPDPKTAARLTWAVINAARVAQAVPVFSELLGNGTGEPDQSFATANTPVLPASVALVVQDPSGATRNWRMTDDLLSSAVEEEVFTLDPESGQVRFGDGVHGSRPALGSRLLISYEYGGGLQGNVGIGAVKTSRDLRLQGGYRIENPVPTSGGDLGESVAEAERSIPLFLRHRDRLVTMQDFRDVTQRTPGVDVGRVEVLPLYLPGDPPQEPAPGVVTVMVIPQFDAVQPLWPTPDRLFLTRVCEFLDPRRLVTTEVYVRKPDYVPVYITVGVQVRAGYFADIVLQTVRDRINGYLSSLPPGGPDGRGWPLAKRLMTKDIEAVITRVPGVEFVNSIEMGVRTPAGVAEYDLTGLELPLVAGLDVQEGDAEPLANVFGQGGSGGTAPDVQTVPVPVIRSKC